MIFKATFKKPIIVASFLFFVFSVSASCLISTPVTWTDDRSCLNDNPQIQVLKSYIPNEALNSINPDFYTYFGYRDWWRAPLVHPYSIHAIDGLDNGFLVDESATTDYETDSVNDAVDLISGIQNFTFSKLPPPEAAALG